MVAETKGMPLPRTESATEVVISDVTIETVQDELMKARVKPGQRVLIRVQNDPWNDFFALGERVSDRAKRLGLPEEKLEKLLDD